MLGSVNLATANCLDYYVSWNKKQMYSINKKIEKVRHDKKRAHFFFDVTRGTFLLPYQVGSVCYQEAAYGPKPVLIFPLVGIVLAPPLVAPLTTVGAIAAGTTASAFAIKKEIEQLQIPKKKKQLELVHQLLLNLKEYKENGTEENLKKLTRFLEHQEIQNEYSKDQDAILDLIQANEENFFCPLDENAEPQLMKYKEILAAIKNGTMKAFLKNRELRHIN
jgi:hypothetical protein